MIREPRRIGPWAALAALAAACASDPPRADVAAPPPEPGLEAADAPGRAPEPVHSLLGEPLAAPQMTGDERERKERDLAEAEAAWRARPDDPLAWTWYGRRLAYLYRYADAVEVYTQGIERFPDDARLYRHRGHRWITLRRFDRAVADLERAAYLIAGQPDEPEPPGQLDPGGVVRDTLHRNVFYHLALARFLRGDTLQSYEAWAKALAISPDPESRAAVTNWAAATLFRLKRFDEANALLAAIDPAVEVTENRAYQRLCLAYTGRVDLEALYAAASGPEAGANDRATVGFGVGNWCLTHGREERALEIFREVVAAGPWPAFGCIAAEAELARRAGAER